MTNNVGSKGMDKRGLHVLLVEDRAADAELLEYELRRAGFEPHCYRVDTEADYLAHLDPEPDIILADHSLPQFDTFRALELLQERELDVPLIIVSGTIGEDLAMAAIRQGAADYLLKDRLAQLGQAVSAALKQRRLRAEKHNADRALLQSEACFRQLTENIREVFYISDPENSQILYISPAYETVWGRSCESLYAQPQSWTEALYPQDRERIFQAFERQKITGEFDEEYRIVRPDGTLRWIRARAFPIRDTLERIYRIAGIAEDITERKEAEVRLLYLAHHDSLTGLPNRALFYDRLKHALDQARRHHWMVAVMFINLDRFKVINDTLGHILGDKLLQTAAKRLTGCVRLGNTMGRLSGDEFSVIIPDLSDGQAAALIAQKILSAFSQPFQLDHQEVFITTSIGISLFPTDSQDPQSLIANADTAMYRAKELGHNGYQFYMAEMNARALEKLSLENALRRALEREEFRLHYQPKIDLNSGRVMGMEALLRWQRSGIELVSPSEFIPLLEETGLIVPVGEWVLRAACVQSKTWQALDGAQMTGVAINLSARQFKKAELVEMVARVLAETGLDPCYLEVEITESLVMHNIEDSIAALRALKDMGVQIAVDDFGTGYSCLAYLKRFAVDSLKIDQSFVRDISTDPNDAGIVKAIISMAHSLGIKVIAEGVETEAQLNFLRAHDCDQIQGYYISPPLAAEKVTTTLRKQWAARTGS